MARKRWSPYGMDPVELARIIGEAERIRQKRLDRIWRKAHAKTARKMRARRKRMERERCARVAAVVVEQRRLFGAPNRGRGGLSRLVLSIEKVVAARMVAGEWYDVRSCYDLAPEYSRNGVRCALARLERAGVVERAPNADFDAAKADRRQVEPRWLRRLTPGGMLQAQEWRGVLG